MVRPSKRTKKTPRQLEEQKVEAFEKLEEVEVKLESEYEAFKRAKRHEAEERIPGKIVNGTKIAWTRSDVEQRWPVCTFVPDITTTVTFNGVTYQLLSGAENHVPTVIRDQFYRCRRKAASAGRSLPDTGFITEVFPGAGALSPE